MPMHSKTGMFAAAGFAAALTVSAAMTAALVPGHA